MIYPSPFEFPVRRVVRVGPLVRSLDSARTSLMLMIWMTIPANALIYGTFLNSSPASFAIFNTVSTMFVVVDATYSELVVDGIATGNEGTTGRPWVTVVIQEACNSTVCSGSIVAKQSLNVKDKSGGTLYGGVAYS